MSSRGSLKHWQYEKMKPECIDTHLISIFQTLDEGARHATEGGWRGLSSDCSSTVLWGFWVWPDGSLKTAQARSGWGTKERSLLEAPEGAQEGGQVGGSSRRHRRSRIWGPFRMQQQMVDKEAAWHALTLIQVYRGGKRDCFHFFCRGPQSMHEQCNLFKSHSILLFMSRQVEAKKQDYWASQVIFIETGSEWSTVCRGQHSVDLLKDEMFHLHYVPIHYSMLEFFGL